MLIVSHPEVNCDDLCCPRRSRLVDSGPLTMTRSSLPVFIPILSQVGLLGGKGQDIGMKIIGNLFRQHHLLIHSQNLTYFPFSVPGGS